VTLASQQVRLNRDKADEPTVSQVRSGRAASPHLWSMRLVNARCSVDYVGRLTAHLPEATRLLVQRADGSLLVHSDTGGYKPLTQKNQ
jgi:RecB family endonuclease NucS